MGTKENNTKATETANEFTWTLDNTSKIFPIDYSVHELSDKHCWDPRAIRKNLICNPLIKDTLYQLLEGNEEKNGTKRKVHLDNFKATPQNTQKERPCGKIPPGRAYIRHSISAAAALI